MSFLRNLTPFLVSRQGYTRAGNTRSLIHDKVRHQQQGERDNEEHEYDDAHWVDSDPKDRSVTIDVETSIRYLNSEAYKKSYGDNLIWTLYRRIRTSPFLKETRKKCIRSNQVSVASPCPICRDMYLVLDHRNIKLLEQFISPHSGEILPSMKTGLCQKQQKRLIIAVMRAKEYGTIPFSVAFRSYDYKFYKEDALKLLKEKALKDQ